MTKTLKTDLKYPSFSVIYETENLSSVELENIFHSLASIAAQDYEIELANEFLIIDSGDAPEEVIEQLSAKYTWIKVKQIPGITYHEAKMKGAALVSGEIVIFADSDCVYEPNWLRNMLAPFINNSEVNVLAGETATPIRNPYELAVAMNYLFRRFSGQKQPYETRHYHLNSVAFRRKFLLQNPIPLDLPLYRGHCKIHTHYLCNIKGYKIFKQPEARAIHEPPTVSFIFWRYLLYGRDDIISERSKLDLTQKDGLKNDYLLQSKPSFIRQILKPFKPKQVLEVLREEPRRILMLPLAIPIVLWFRVLFVIGQIVTYFQPDLILDRYKNSESKQVDSVSVTG